VDGLFTAEFRRRIKAIWRPPWIRQSVKWALA
jgi:hypothetical protein